MGTKPMKRMGCLLVAILAMFLFMIYALLCADSEPFDDSALSALPAPLPEEQNQFPALMDATNAWVDPPDVEMIRLWSMGETNLNREEAAWWVEQNRPVLAQVEAALARPGYQSPPVTSLVQSIYWLTPLKNIARLMMVDSQLLLENGKRGEASARALEIAAMGHRFQRDGSILSDYLVGRSIQEMGLRQVLASGLTLTNRQELMDLELKVRPLGQPGDITRALRGEYRGVATIVRDIATGQINLREFTDFHPLLLNRVTLRLVLHPNRTRLQFFQTYQEVIRRWGEPLVEKWDLPNSEPGYEPPCYTRNWFGLSIFNMLMWPPDSIRERAASLESLGSQVRLVLALRSYQAEKGEWPDDLQKLVPAYLPEIPRDPYDGKAMKYDAATRRVYALGPDLVDNGGDIHRYGEEPPKDIGVEAELVSDQSD